MSINPSRTQTQNAIEGLNYAQAERVKYLHRKLFDLIHDCELCIKGLETGKPIPNWYEIAQALREAIARAKPEGR